MDESEFVRLWVSLDPACEEALEVGLPCAPDAAEASTPVDVLTVAARLASHDTLGGLLFGLTGADVHDLVGHDAPDVVAVGTLLRAAHTEMQESGDPIIEPVHLLLGLLAFDSLALTRELAWGGISYERAKRWSRRRRHRAR